MKAAITPCRPWGTSALRLTTVEMVPPLIAVSLASSLGFFVASAVNFSAVKSSVAILAAPILLTANLLAASFSAGFPRLSSFRRFPFHHSGPLSPPSRHPSWQGLVFRLPHPWESCPVAPLWIESVFVKSVSIEFVSIGSASIKFLSRRFVAMRLMAFSGLPKDRAIGCIFTPGLGGLTRSPAPAPTSNRDFRREDHQTQPPAPGPGESSGKTVPGAGERKRIIRPD